MSDVFIRWSIPLTVPGAPITYVSVFDADMWAAYGDGDPTFLLRNTRTSIASVFQARYGVRPEEKAMTWEHIDEDEAELWTAVDDVLWDAISENSRDLNDA